MPEVIHGDGTLYRFSTNGKRMDQSGWYVFARRWRRSGGRFWLLAQRSISDLVQQGHFGRNDPGRAQRAAVYACNPLPSSANRQGFAQARCTANGGGAGCWWMLPVRPSDHRYLDLRNGCMPAAKGRRRDGCDRYPARWAGQTALVAESGKYACCPVGTTTTRLRQPGGRAKAATLTLHRPGRC